MSLYAELLFKRKPPSDVRSAQMPYEPAASLNGKFSQLSGRYASFTLRQLQMKTHGSDAGEVDKELSVAFTGPVSNVGSG